jgi:16S rRNA (guanine(966)-N(2))-methyltransferase RsmD
MRVIGGEFRSRVLKTLPGLDTRPTPDRLRETLFNILAPRIGGCVFVDLYAGTGAVGIEALSRGASKAVLVEVSRAGVGVIRANLQSLGIEGRADVRQGKAAAALESVRGTLGASIVFLDPPYEAAREYDAVLSKLGDLPGTEAPALVIAQHDTRMKLAERYGGIARTRVVKQGSNCLTFWGAAAEPEPDDPSTPTDTDAAL